MKRVFLVGDFKSNTGPAIVNKQLKKCFGNCITYSEKDNYVDRIFELLKKTKNHDVICFSGYSKINIIGMILTKIFRKKSVYLMHGYGMYEDKINEETSIKRFFVENTILILSDSIICVSKLFMEFMKKKRPFFRKKYDYIYNGIDLKCSENTYVDNSKRKKNNVIISVGGGRPQKNIIKICEAIEKINLKTDLNLKFIVIGKQHLHTDAICKYSFVEYLESVPSNEMNTYYSKADLYIQNSIFETFGLAIIEALNAGCNILISKNIGVRDAFKNSIDSDIIEDCFDVTEIADKILYNLNNSNNQRLITNLDLSVVDINQTSKRLMKIL